MHLRPIYALSIAMETMTFGKQTPDIQRIVMQRSEEDGIPR